MILFFSVLSILTGIVFVLPPVAVEKVIVGILVVILNLQFLTYITATIPHSPSHTPLIGIAMLSIKLRYMFLKYLIS